MADTFVKNPKVIYGPKDSVIAEMSENDFGIASDVEFYTKQEIDEASYITRNEYNDGASEFNSELETKADSDLGNIPTNYDYVVESQLPTADNGYTWYRKYKSGWVEQGGYSSTVSGSVNITLPIEMSSSVYDIQTQALIGSPVSDTTTVNRNAARAYIRMPFNQTTTGFSFQTTSDMGQIGTYWQVCGMAA